MQAIVSSLGDSCCSDGDLVAHIGVLIVLAQVALHKPGIVSVYSQSPWVLMSQQDRELVVVDIIDVHDQQLSVPVLGNGRLCSRRSNLLSKALTPFHTGGWWW